MSRYELAIRILTWWKDAQYFEDYPGHNLFNDDPDFVVEAKKICGEMASARILNPYFTDEQVVQMYG